MESKTLPPPPPMVPDNVVPKKLVVGKREPMARRDQGKKGQKVQLLTNHFKVAVAKNQGSFYHYSVSMCYDDGNPVEAKGVGRKVMEKVQETYSSEMDGKYFAYDGLCSLFTLGPLPRNKLEFSVVLEELSLNRNMMSGDGGSPQDGDRKRTRRQSRSTTYQVQISYAAQIPLQSITNALHGQDSEHFHESVRVLDIILRQNAAKQGCLLVRQSYFHNQPRNFIDLTGGVSGCRGFHSSFRATQGGLSLNIDVSTTMIVKPGPVIDFLIANQGLKEPYDIDWVKAKKTVKSLRITAAPTNREFKITGLSPRICKEQMFSLKRDNDSTEISVYNYFVDHRRIPLRFSADFPCIDVGKGKRPVYIPIELCTLIPLQRYTKALSSFQRSSLVEKSRQKPQERMRTLTEGLKCNNYNDDPLLKSSGISIHSQFTAVEGRVLPAPQLIAGNGDSIFSRNGRWNFNNKRLVKPVTIEEWGVVNFSFRVDTSRLVKELIACGQRKGVSIKYPVHIAEENPRARRFPAHARVEEMLKDIQPKFTGRPTFILCILPEKKNSDLYGPWKRKMLSEHGIPTQCMVPAKFNDQYLTNVLLKINAKLGGMNSLLTVEHSPSLPMISKIPTMIMGMDVSHGSPGRDVPSVAAVVSSLHWPLISRYRAAVRTQSPKMEMIDNLFQLTDDGVDKGIIGELLRQFYYTSHHAKPEQIIIFRDGVSEGQFNQVLNIELEQIKEACKFLDSNWFPKFMLIIAQKNHHTKFFQTNSPDNVPPGTVIDNGICHPKNNDFYMCAQAGMIGTTRPTHYHVLYDEIGFSADNVQELVHSLSYVYQRSTTAISVVSPVNYAHLAAAQVAQFIKLEELSETNSSHGGGSSSGTSQIPELPRLHRDVWNSMYFC